MTILKKARQWLRPLFRPSARWPVIVLLVAGVVLGVVGMLGFNYSLQATNTEAFCTSCHEMYAQPFQSVQQTAHFNNRSGVRPICADCHVPHEFVPKMIRKVEAAREVWGHLTGMVDTPEKYAAHLDVMKAREIARLRANDSAECRNCHDVARMDLALQSEKARLYHAAMDARNKTCIDCHQGIAHTYPVAPVTTPATDAAAPQD